MSNPSQKEGWHWIVTRELWDSCLSLWRSPRFTLPALLSLALGIGASTAAFAVISALMLRPLPFADEDGLVDIGFADMAFNDVGTFAQQLTISSAVASELGLMKSTFSSIAVQRSMAARVMGPSGPNRAATEFVTPNFFQTLGLSGKRGRLFHEGDNADGVVVRHAYWQSTLGGGPLVGTELKVGIETKTVLGVLANEGALPNWTDIYLMTPLNAHDTWLSKQAIARLAPGVSVAVARQRLAEFRLSARNQHRNREGQPLVLTARPLRDRIVGTQRSSIALIAAAVLAFLMLAGANVAALLATRASVRRRERAIRVALGAGRWTQLRHDMMEAGLLSFFGGGLGLLAVSYGLDSFNPRYHDAMANTPARVDWGVAAAFVLILSLCALAGALSPSLSMGRLRPMEALQGEGRSTSTRASRRLREILVSMQVVVTVVLLINAGLLNRSVNGLLAVDPGFDSGGVVTAQVMMNVESIEHSPEGRKKQTALVLPQMRAIEEQLRALPAVQSVTLAADLPFDWFVLPMGVELEPGARKPRGKVVPHWVGEGYRETFGIPLLSGQSIDSLMTKGNAAVVNRAFARELLGVEDAVGHRFRTVAPPGAPEGLEIPWIEILGMIDDTLEVSLDEPAPPSIYLPFFSDPLRIWFDDTVNFCLAVKTGGSIKSLLAAIPPAVDRAAPEALSFLVQPLQKQVEKSFEKRASLKWALSALALASAILAAIGLYGVTSYGVAQRSAEVGIRRALGASCGAVLSMIIRETGGVLLVAVVVGLVLSWFSGSLLDSFVFGIAAADPLTYAIVSVGVLTVGLLAALLPARAAARTSPSHALTRP